ncbi:hypothetical protein Trco_004869 [Trichoderma cornu-damae]|uniref:Uncharacterized protein n=1 Tax=Trichoderma cornu-damae TaxID=654480 RepID=A0A9P8QIA2_9HYPO|nr:hypothetical protein Trco_004869 [Trichoderma cornu-damae]
MAGSTSCHEGAPQPLTICSHHSPVSDLREGEWPRPGPAPIFQSRPQLGLSSPRVGREEQSWVLRNPTPKRDYLSSSSALQRARPGSAALFSPGLWGPWLRPFPPGLADHNITLGIQYDSAGAPRGLDLSFQPRAFLLPKTQISRPKFPSRWTFVVRTPNSPMYSLVTVNQQVSLISVTVTPSTFLAALLVLLVFVSFYLPKLPSFTLPRIPLPRIFPAAEPSEKALPPLPPSPTSPDRQLVVRDQSLTVYRRERRDSYKDRFRKEPKDHHCRDRDCCAKESDHGRSPRKARRLVTGFRDSGKNSSVLPSETAIEDDLLADLDAASAGSYSPPAWRRLANGSRSNGFWRAPSHDALGAMAPMRLAVRSTPFNARCGGDDLDDLDDLDDDDDGGGGLGRDADNRNDILQRAIRTRLPTGSMSPDKVRSRSPEANRSGTLRFEAPTPPVLERILESPPPTDNCNLRLPGAQPVRASPVEDPAPDPSPLLLDIRFAVRAEVQQRTEPIETAISFIRKRYAALTASWTSTLFSLLLAVFSISLFKTLVQEPAPRPVGDLVKVAGIARSFEPLIYYSEHAITQVHDLQATSVAVWDLGETVRTSGMRDASLIVADLDALSASMKTLATEMTKFFAVVDGDIDGSRQQVDMGFCASLYNSILNVMDWAKMHLNRLQSAPSPSTLSSAYDNIHNMLSEAHVLEDASGSPTPLGTLTTYVFGLSNPQREQRMVQLLFNEFLSILEESVREELRYSMNLYGLFNSIDQHFLNLARTVARETSAQEELHSDMLASLWVRILGTRAAELRKFEQNRVLLRDVREKTVRNKGILVNHHSKLLSLQTSLEGLRTKLISPLVRGANATILTLEDQIDSLSGVRDHLAELRRQQKGKVMETLYASVPSKQQQRSLRLDDGRSGFLGDS